MQAFMGKRSLRIKSVQLLISAANRGGGWAAARSALCAIGCESRACGVGSVTVEDIGVTVEVTVRAPTARISQCKKGGSLSHWRMSGLVNSGG